MDFMRIKPPITDRGQKRNYQTRPQQSLATARIRNTQNRHRKQINRRIGGRPARSRLGPGWAPCTRGPSKLSQANKLPERETAQERGAHRGPEQANYKRRENISTAAPKLHVHSRKWMGALREGPPSCQVNNCQERTQQDFRSWTATSAAASQGDD
jgi:hypothetical protein